MTCKDGRFNTGNKVCSNDLRDLNDDVIIVDGYVNSKELYIEDRLGVERLTLAGIESINKKQMQEIQDHADSTIGEFDGKIDAIIKGAGGVKIVNEWSDSIEDPPSVGFIESNLGYVTPEMFGAVGDGVNDDTVAVQKALDKLRELGGGVLSGNNGKAYVVRNTAVPSNIVVRDMIINQLVESEPLSQWQLIKHIFSIVDVKNVTFSNLTIDGKRGEQNLDNAGTQDGGCVAFDIGKGARDIKFLNCTVTNMATDALQIYGYTSATEPSDGPYDILVSGCNFSLSRRNNISVISVDGLHIENTRLDKSGLEVEGTQSGKQPIKSDTGRLWAAPSIDFEPEKRCSISNVTMENCSIEGSRSGILIYGGVTQTDISITNLSFKNTTVKNTVTGDSFKLEGYKHPIKNIYVQNLHGYGMSNVNISAGEFVSIDNILNYSDSGDPFYNSFSTVSGQTSKLVIGVVKDLIFKNVRVGNYGLSAWEFARTPSDIPNLLFDSSCFVSTTQSGNIGDLLVFSNQQTPQLTPNIFGVSRKHNLPLFKNEYGSIIHQPVFKNNAGGKPEGDTGSYGWHHARSGRKVTGVGGGKWNTDKLSVTNVVESDLGLSIATKHADGRVYKGTVTGVDVVNNSWTISPNLSFGSIAEGADVFYIEYKEMYPLFKQGVIEKLQTNATSSEIVAKINQIIDALKLSNTIK